MSITDLIFQILVLLFSFFGLGVGGFDLASLLERIFSA